ncbi:PP2C family protein-serine/threonine phosphatase [Phocaeicola sp.]
MKIYISAQTDMGKERTNNEDAFVFCPDLAHPNWTLNTTNGYIPLGSLGSLSVVADGMGGANAGEIASSIAIETIKKKFVPDKLLTVILSDQSMHDFLESVIKEADIAIRKYINSDPDTIGMGTTIVVLWIINDKAHIAWCGDSRCYAFNIKTGLKSLTKDHSYVQELIDKGELSAKKAFNHPDSNLITRCLGDIDASAIPDILTYQINPQEILFLCSDGLCGCSKDKEIEKVLYRKFEDIQKCCSSLVEISLDSGGYDNITVVLMSFIADNLKEPSMSKVAKMIRTLKCWFK